MGSIWHDADGYPRALSLWDSTDDRKLSLGGCHPGSRWGRDCVFARRKYLGNLENNYERLSKDVWIEKELNESLETKIDELVRDISKTGFAVKSDVKTRLKEILDFQKQKDFQEGYEKGMIEILAKAESMVTAKEVRHLIKDYLLKKVIKES